MAGAPSRGCMRSNKAASFMFAALWSDFSTAIVRISCRSDAISFVISTSQSTVLLVPQVPAVPIRRGTPILARAAINSPQSDFVDDREYLLVPVPK